MNPEQQRIAIAEACGWKFYPEHDVEFQTPAGKVFPECWRLETDEEQTCACADGLPNYLSDLNAMHEAEKVLTVKNRNHYIDLLGAMHHDSWEFCTATAAQRAEAFLKTFNLWTEL